MFSSSTNKDKEKAGSGENVWATVLKESAKRSHLLDEKTILVLGACQITLDSTRKHN